MATISPLSLIPPGVYIPPGLKQERSRILSLDTTGLITEIKNLLQLNDDKPKNYIFNQNESIFDFDYTRERNDESKAKFIAFLKFVLLALKQTNSTVDSFTSYTVDDISQEETTLFNEKKEKYDVYLNISKVRSAVTSNSRLQTTPQGFTRFLTLNQLQLYNRQIIRKYMKDKDYDEVSPEFFLGIFRQRIAEMNACFTLHETSGFKTPEELLYLRIESKRESIMLQSIEAKIQTQSLPLEKEQLKDLIMIELKKMSSYIIWGCKHILCYYNLDGTLKSEEQLDADINEILHKIEDAKGRDKNCVKKLMTFLPLSIFVAVNIKTHNSTPLTDSLTDADLSLYLNEQYEFNYDEAKLRAFYKSNGIPHDYETGRKLTEEELSKENNGIIKGPQIQYRLGLNVVLFNEPLKVYSELDGLFNVFGLNVDLFNNCGRYVNYNIYLNLLKLYLQTIKTDSVFSTSMSLVTSHKGEDGFDSTSESYQFRYRGPIKISELFGPDVKFLGCHFFKHKNDNGQPMRLPLKPMLLPLFVFKNEKYDSLKRLPITDTAVEAFIKKDIFISIYGGNICEINTFDLKGCFVEDGEITPTMSITYHELTNMLYYGAKTYMVGDDIKELYFTMLPNDNPKLQQLVLLLKMTQVFFVHGKVKGFERKRFKVVKKEEAVELLNERPQIWRLMGNQVIEAASPLLGGYKKSNKSNNKIKTTKTRKMMKLKQHNKTNKTKKNTKTKKTVKNNKSKIYARKTKKIIK